MSKERVVESVMFFSNGNTVVFDQHGEPMRKLQKGWLEIFALFLETQGFDPTLVKYTLPDGRDAKLFWSPSNGTLNWRIL